MSLALDSAAPGWSGGWARGYPVCMHQPSGCQERGHDGFTGVISRALGEGRQRQISVALGKKTRKGGWFARVRPPPIHPSIHSFNKNSVGIYLVPSSGPGCSIREGVHPSLDSPGELPGRDRVLGDGDKLAWETRLGREFQTERDHARGLVCYLKTWKQVNVAKVW